MSLAGLLLLGCENDRAIINKNLVESYDLLMHREFSSAYISKFIIEIEDEIFTASVPLDENYSADFQISSIQNKKISELTKRQQEIIFLMKNTPETSYIERKSATKDGVWVVKK